MMTTKPSYKVFRFRNRVEWKSGRHGTIRAADKPAVEVSSPPQFNGEEATWSPEDLFLATVNVCLMQTFMEYVHRTDLGLISYDSAAEGVLERAEGRYRFTEFHLQPVIVVKSEEDVGRAAKILDAAESACLISNSIRATVKSPRSSWRNPSQRRWQRAPADDSHSSGRGSHQAEGLLHAAVSAGR